MAGRGAHARPDVKRLLGGSWDLVTTHNCAHGLTYTCLGRSYIRPVRETRSRLKSPVRSEPLSIPAGLGPFRDEQSGKHPKVGDTF